MIKAMASYTRKDLESLAKERGDEICKLKQEYAHLEFRTEQNRLDTALAASLQSALHTLCRCAINKKGARSLAMALEEKTE